MGRHCCRRLVCAAAIFLKWIYLTYEDVTAVEGILYGIKPAVTAIVVFSVYRIGSRALTTMCFVVWQSWHLSQFLSL